jgi:DNA repair protein RadA/Sms
VRECATALLHVAKRQGVPIFLVGHVTKAGDIAGPRVLEHIVDCVVYMEGERQQSFRLVRGIKNRYGPTDEVLAPLFLCLSPCERT